MEGDEARRRRMLSGKSRSRALGNEVDADQHKKNLEYPIKISAMEAAGEIDNFSFDDFLACHEPSMALYDADQHKKNREYQIKISAMEAAGEIDNFSFDDFLARLKDLEKLQYLIPEAAAKDQIQTLKLELKFLKTFSKCIARNESLKEADAQLLLYQLSNTQHGDFFSKCLAPAEASKPEQIQKTLSKGIAARNDNLKDSSAFAISAIKRAAWGLFSKCPAPGEVGIPVNAMSVLSDALQGIKENRPKIIYFYDRVSVSSDSYTHMTCNQVLELISDLLQNLKDLLRSKAALVVSFRSQIVALKEELQFLQNFLDFAKYRDQENLKELLTHSEAMAISLAHLCYTLLSDKMNEEPSLEMNLKLSDLLRKMKATKPEVREMYLRVLKSSQLPELSDAYAINNDVLGAFVDFLQHCLREFLNSEFRFKHPVQDHLKVLDEKLRFLRIILVDPPTQYIDMRSIDAVITQSGLLLFSINVDEMAEESAMHMNLMLVNLLEEMNGIEQLAKKVYLRISKSSRSEFSKTDGLGFIRSLVENLKELLYRTDTSIAFLKHQIETITKDFESFTSLLSDKEKQLNQHNELKSLWTRVIDLAYETEFIIDSFLVNDGPGWHYMLWLSDVLEEIQIIKAEVTDFNTKMAHDIGVNNVKKPSSIALPSQANSPALNERVVGFEDEEEKLIELLIGGSSRLDAVSIVGMAGLGKTTLSKKIFNSDLVEKRFHVRGWCSVSEVYQKKAVLLSLLKQVAGLKDVGDKDVGVLEQLLHQRLKGRKYLIVLDDIWTIEAWSGLKISFPDDGNGSRIMFTTRHLDFAFKAKLQSYPLSLRPFHDEESWKLLEQLVFPEEFCPSELKDIGKQIAKNCKGVPLSVALISGILATDKTHDFWNQVSQSLTSRIFYSPERQTKDIIEMSYKHLPYHLRPCFLYFGGLLEDQELPVKRLIWLWTAEGFVRKPEGRSIEESAEDYLNILINRSLVSISKRKADGGIKECRVHDLLFHYCKVKSREEKFWQFDGFTSDYGDEFNYSCPGTPTYEHHRLCMYYHGDSVMWSRASRPSGSHVRTILLHNANYKTFFVDQSFLIEVRRISNRFKLLKVLDLESLDVCVFPDGLEMLVLLKYLALKTDEVDFIPASIGSLWNLETFILKAIKNVIMPETFWKMRKLRHLRIRGWVIFDSDFQRRLEFFSGEDWLTKLFAYPDSHKHRRGQRQASFEEDSNQQMLDSLETISGVCLFQGEEEEVLRKIPNVQRLKCCLKDSYDYVSNHNQFPNLNLLRKLESLSINNHRNSRLLQSSKSISFPSKLKKLTWTGFNLPQAEISKIGRLENLEVLKLQLVQFEEHRWDMTGGEFPKLRHLELQDMDIEEWNASSDNFPCLQRLRLISIYRLREVPSCFVSVPTLEMIEVRKCYELDLESVWEIQREQEENGNNEFKVIASDNKKR